MHFQHFSLPYSFDNELNFNVVYRIFFSKTKHSMRGEIFIERLSHFKCANRRNFFLNIHQNVAVFSSTHIFRQKAYNKVLHNLTLLTPENGQLYCKATSKRFFVDRFRGLGAGWAGWAIAHPLFGRSNTKFESLPTHFWPNPYYAHPLFISFRGPCSAFRN